MGVCLPLLRLTPFLQTYDSSDIYVFYCISWLVCLSASLSRIHTHDGTIIPSSGWPYLMGKSQDVGLLKLEQGSHSSAKNLSNCLVGCGDQCTYRVPWLYTSATNSSCTVHQVPWSPCSFSQLIPGTRWKHWQKWKHTRPLIVSTRRTCLNKVHNSRQWLLFLVRRTRPHHQSLGGGAKL